MKAWQIALIGVGVVVAGVVVVKIATAPSATPSFGTSGSQPGNGIPNQSLPTDGTATSNAVAGGFGLATRIADGIFSQVRRDRDIAAHEREMNGDGGGKGEGMADSGYDPHAAFLLKTGGRA